MVLIGKIMDRQQLDRGDAKGFYVRHDLVGGEAGEGAAEAERQCRVADGVAAHVGLVEDRAVPRDARALVATPGEGGVDDPAFRHEGSTVAQIERQVGVGMADRVAEDLGGVLHLADMRARIRVEQELVRVEPVAGLRRVRSVHPVAVDGAGAGVRQIAVPDLIGIFGQFYAIELGPAGWVEQAELDLGGIGREQGEIHPQSVPGGPERVGQALGQSRGPVAAYHEGVSWKAHGRRLQDASVQVD